MTDLVVVSEASLSVVAVEAESNGVHTTEEQMVVVVSSGEQGPVGPQGEQGVPGSPGPAGPAGPAGASGDVAFIYPAAASVSGHRVVTLDEQGEVIYASAGTEAHANRIIGMTTNAAATGDALNVKKFGEVTEPSWNWDVQLPVYLGTDGLLTQTPPVAPTAKFSVVVGFPISATTLFVNIGLPITLTL